MRKPELVLTLALLGATAISSWLWTELRAERVRNAELAARVAALTADTTSGTLVAAAAPERATSREPPKKATSTTPASPSIPSPPETEVREQLQIAAHRDREMLRDPAYRKAQIEGGRPQFARTRADAIRIVGMTPQQADRVIDLWIERNLRFRELSMGMPGDQPSEAVQTQLERAGDAEQAELRALLGAETYEKWGRYLASGEERAEVGLFREQLAGGKEPLRDSQADELVEILYTERQRRSNEYEQYASSMGIVDRNIVSAQDRQRWLDLEKEANQRIHSAAANLLSTSQLTSLDGMLANRLVPIETTLRLQLGKN